MGFLTTALEFFFSRSGYASLLGTGSCSRLHLTLTSRVMVPVLLSISILSKMSDVVLVTKLNPCFGWKSCLGIDKII